jgi:glycosyltransferase A (GT-A) superfamily protein (DUF2064 family)
MRTQLLVIAKAPVPGRVKTRLCPPCTPAEAADIAAAALADTLRAGYATPVARHTIVLSGQYEPPPGWYRTSQRGDGLADRLANGFADTAVPGVASVLIGMDTPQVTPELLDGVANGLEEADAVLGPALDGGWWTLALRDPRHAEALRPVPMSTVDARGGCGSGWPSRCATWTPRATRGRSPGSARAAPSRRRYAGTFPWR